jgi:outer membrane protein, heavy metal efflux system
MSEVFGPCEPRIGKTSPTPWTGLARKGLARTAVAMAIVAVATLARPAAATPAPASGEPTLPSPATLEDLLARAAAHHPGLAAARMERLAEEERVPQARSLPDPSLSLQARTMDRQVGVGVSQMLPLAGRRERNAAIAQEGANAAGRRAQARALAVDAEVAGAYSELVYLLRAQELVAENLALVGQLVEVALARYRTGEAPYADVLRAQLELARVEDELRSLQDVEGAAEGRLNAALGRPATAPLPELAPLPAADVALSDEEVLAAVAEANPSLAATRHETAAAGQRLELARRNGTPDLMLGAELMRSFEMDRFGAGIMVGVNLPIRKERRAAEVREAEARVAASAARETEAGLGLQAEARLALYRYRDAGRRVALYADRLIPQAEQSLAATQTAYRSAEATFGELIETARMALELRMTLERLRADRLQGLASLESLVGRRVRP